MYIIFGFGMKGGGNMDKPFTGERKQSHKCTAGPARSWLDSYTLAKEQYCIWVIMVERCSNLYENVLTHM